jgi:hypothetical protein
VVEEVEEAEEAEVVVAALQQFFLRNYHLH